MHKINVADINTNDRQFPIVRDAALERYRRLRSQHAPGR